jgi:O-antigen/teichoic acid export membrane protein
MGASVVGQAVSFIGSLAVARLYGPADVGLFALFSAVWGVAVIAASWRYELAIVTSDEDGRAADVALLVVCAAAMSAVAACGALLAIAVFPGNFGISAALRQELMVGVPALMVAGLNVAGTNICLRYRLFRRIGLQQVANAVITIAAQMVLLGIALPGGGLVMGFLLGQVASSAVFARPLVPLLVARLRAPGVLDRLWREARENRGYFLYTVPYTLVTQLYYQTPVLVLGSYLGAKEVGFFNLAYRTTSTPFGLLPVALSQVLFPDMARDGRSMTDWGPRMQAILIGLGILFAPVAAVIVAFGPDIYALLLGEKWRETGGLAALLVVPNLMAMLCSGYDRLYAILDRQRMTLALTVPAFILSLATMIAATRYAPTSTWLVGGWGLAHLIYVFAWMAGVWHAAGFFMRKLLAAWALIIGLVVALAMTFGLADAVCSGQPWAIALAVLALTGYGLLAWRVSTPLKGMMAMKGRNERKILC